MGVVHCKREKYDVYIGRPSRWGNPFQIGPDGTREEVVEKYRIWLYKQIQQGEIFRQFGYREKMDIGA